MSTFVKVLIIIIILAVLGAGGYIGWRKYLATPTTQTTSTSGKAVTIPAALASNQFGFLSAGADDYKFINQVGAGWVRPHPGAFLWDAMQKSKTGSLDFKNADKEIKKYGDQNIAILATLWPFAEWDQKERDGFDRCAVSSSDEFLLDISGKRGEEYISEHRCAPVNWELYKVWVKAVVERYDGDGQSDMNGLKIPIKYWEVMNEPDLSSPEGETRLDFWKDGAGEYAQLLVRTSVAIKEADPEAKVVIAGAAGGSNQFLNFYREVLAVTGAKEAFDIGNIHCISNDNFDSFNVEPYKKLLAEFGLNKPIWVTEAEAMISDDASVNATQTKNSTKKALELGAAKIFYTRYNFEVRDDLGDKPKPPKTNLTADMDGKDPAKAYQTIIKSVSGTN